MTKRIYKFENKEFSSIKQLSEYVGINVKTLTARLRKGMPIEEACNTKDFRCHYFNVDGQEKFIGQICDEESKNVELVRNRLKYGYSMHEALNKPKKISRQGHPIVVNGILYNSVAEAVRKLGLSERESTIRGRLASGKTPDNAFMFKD